jgi:hypothetical protein
VKFRLSIFRQLIRPPEERRRFSISGDHFVNIESFNENTGKGWTDPEEVTICEHHADRPYGPNRGNPVLSTLQIRPREGSQVAQDNYGLSDAQKVAYESTRAARLAGLSKARQNRHARPRFQQTEHAA